MNVTLDELQGASKTIGMSNLLRWQCVFKKYFKAVLHVAMQWEIPTLGVMNPWLINLPYIRKARYWYIFRAKIPPLLCQLKHLHPFNVLCLWFTCPSHFLRLLERNLLPSKIQVDHIILNSKSVLIFISETRIHHSCAWCYLDSFRFFFRHYLIWGRWRNYLELREQ